MKLFGYILAASLACTFCACEKESLLQEPPVDNSGNGQEKPDKPSGEQLCITASLEGMQESRGIIESFVPGHEMGIFVEEGETGTANARYVFDGKDWNTSGDVPVDGDADVVAYLPYDKDVADLRNVPFNLGDQNDILYGTSKVTKEIPVAALGMKHAMTLVRVRLMKNEYMGTGQVSGMTFGNVYTKGTVDASAGTVTKDFSSGLGEVRAGGNFMLNDDNPVIVDAILIPRLAYDEPARVSFTIDGQNHTYEFPVQHEWKAGMKYTYTLKLTGNYNAPVNKEQVDIDVEYWSKYGKTDDIVINPNPDDYPFKVWPNYTEYGYDTYQNEGKVFGTFYTPFCDDGEGEMRFVFVRKGAGNPITAGDIVEKFQPIDIKTNGAWDGKRIQCYVTSAPGTYRLVPLFRKKGETMWCNPIGYSYGSTPEEWEYEVKAPASDDLPALRMMEVEGQGYTSILAYPVPDNDPWNLVYTLSNRGEKALKGEIKAVWEREFKLKSNSYRPSIKKEGAVNDEEWRDELGMISVDIPAGVRFWKGIMSCKFPVKRLQPMGSNGVSYAGALVHLYWRAEGSKEWILLRCDADYLFNRNYIGGYIWDETTNYVKLFPQSWNNKKIE